MYITILFSQITAFITTGAVCVLQYWDSLSLSYVDYKTFPLSEHRTTSLTLPEATCDYNSSVRVANVWRILIMYVITEDENTL